MTGSCSRTMFWFCSSPFRNCHQLPTSSTATFSPLGLRRGSSQWAPRSLAPSFALHPGHPIVFYSPPPLPRLPAVSAFLQRTAAGTPFSPFRLTPSHQHLSLLHPQAFLSRTSVCILSRDRTCAVRVSPPHSKPRRSQNSLRCIRPSTRTSPCGVRALDARGRTDGRLRHTRSQRCARPS